MIHLYGYTVSDFLEGVLGTGLGEGGLGWCVAGNVNIRLVPPSGVHVSGGGG